MMTTQEIGVMLEILEANYGQKFYDGVNRENVMKLWAAMFRNDDPKLVMQGVQNCINTMAYKPTIADIRRRMAQSQMSGQMTELEAFQEISKAVDAANSRDAAVQAFADLPPVLRKLVGSSGQLRSWRTVGEESFQTVIMSQITRSYRELAQREADYYALPSHLQQAEQWRIEAPSLDELPKPQKTAEEIIGEADLGAAEYRMKMTEELQEKHREQIAAFLAPVTEEDKERVRLSEERKAGFTQQ